MPLVSYKVDKATPVPKLSLQLCMFHDRGNRVFFIQTDRHDGVVWVMMVLLGVMKEWQQFLESEKEGF